jgi:isoleucyl-tRNA synthetase
VKWWNSINYLLRKISYFSRVTECLDQWILAKLQNLIADVTREMEVYNLSEASRPVAEFMVSTWYVRRSRDRFKADEADKAFALASVKFVDPQ